MNRDYEFDAEFDNHPIPDGNIYRLHYIKYYRKNEEKGKTKKNIGILDYTFDNFMLPDNMSREEAFKILSYLTDYLETDLKLEPSSYRSVNELNNILNIERLGFRKVSSPSTNPIDLFTVTGRVLLFKKSEYYNKYFEWYSENITFDEIKSIYQKYGIDFYDLVPKKQENIKILQKTPKKGDQN